MKVDFNNLRRQAIYACDALTQKLNDAIIRNDDSYAKPNGYEWDVNLKGYVLIEAEDIRKQMDSLRMMVGSIAMTFEEENEDFKDVYEEVFPTREEGGMKHFNDEVEELN